MLPILSKTENSYKEKRYILPSLNVFGKCCFWKSTLSVMLPIVTKSKKNDGQYQLLGGQFVVFDGQIPKFHGQIPKFHGQIQFLMVKFQVWVVSFRIFSWKKTRKTVQFPEIKYSLFMIYRQNQKLERKYNATKVAWSLLDAKCQCLNCGRRPTTGKYRKPRWSRLQIW